MNSGERGGASLPHQRCYSAVGETVNPLPCTHGEGLQEPPFLRPPLDFTAFSCNSDSGGPFSKPLRKAQEGFPVCLRHQTHISSLQKPGAAAAASSQRDETGAARCRRSTGSRHAKGGLHAQLRGKHLPQSSCKSCTEPSLYKMLQLLPPCMLVRKGFSHSFHSDVENQWWFWIYDWFPLGDVFSFL